MKPIAASSRASRIFRAIAVAAAVTFFQLHPAEAAEREGATEAPAAPRWTGTAKGGGICSSGFGNWAGSVVPPDAVVWDSPSVATVKIERPCAGRGVARLTTEVFTIDPDGSVVLVAEAKCLKGSGKNGCERGEVLTAEPPGLALSNNPTLATYTAQFLFGVMKPGRWRIDIRAAGDGTSKLQSRTLTVEAFQNP